MKYSDMTMINNKPHHVCSLFMTQGRFMLWLACILATTIASHGQAAITDLNPDSEYHESLKVPLYKSKVIDIKVPIKKVSLGNPDIADILILRYGQIYILGKQLGTTNVMLWDNKSQLIKAIDIEITHDLNTLKAKLHRVLPLEKIEVYSSQSSLILAGQVSSTAKMDTALKIAKSYADAALAASDSKNDKDKDDDESKVVNLMSVGGSQQVMLKVTVAEINRTTMKKIGIKFSALGIGDNNWNLGGVSGGASFPDALFSPDYDKIPLFGTPVTNPINSAIVGPAINDFLPNDLSIADKGLFASFLSNDFVFNMSLEAAKENGSAKILAEPTLTTLSGQEAKFISGGEVPIPIPRGDNGTTIEFKEFGVGIKFVPVVLDSGRINLTLNISVTELASSSSVLIQSSGSSSTFVVPSFTKRAAQSTVELGDGETIGIAGLISENMREIINKFPGLGDIPVLGHLFRSQEFESGETELVIMVTPVLAQPLSQMPNLPTDHFVAPSDLDFYLLGKNYGATTGTSATAENTPPLIQGTATLPNSKGGTAESFGHTIK